MKKQTKKDLMIGAYLAVLLIVVFMFGFLVSPYYQRTDLLTCLKSTQGFHYRLTYQNLPNFICVDVGDISIKKSLEICQHELGYEIYERVDFINVTSEEFARRCQYDWSKCVNLTE